MASPYMISRRDIRNDMSPHADVDSIDSQRSEPNYI